MVLYQIVQESRSKINFDQTGDTNMYNITNALMLRKVYAQEESSGLPHTIGPQTRKCCLVHRKRDSLDNMETVL